MSAASLTLSLLARAAALRAELTRVCTESRRLVEQGRGRRLSTTYPRLRVIRGGSDAGLVALAITDASLCLACVARKTGVPEPEVDAILLRVAGTLKLAAVGGRCDACLELKTVFRLNRTAGDPTVTPPAEPAPPLNLGRAVWRFLEKHRGRMFCAQCLGRALGVPRRLDRAVIAAEGRGARRHYGPCAICGKDRLVCGLS
jgi:hypothetical protein